MNEKSSPATDVGFRVIRLDTWAAFRSSVQADDDRFANWVFRGQGDASWPLMTRLERVAVQRFRRAPKDLRRLELGMLRRFQREAHVHTGRLPSSLADRVAWLAIIQHYGGATRLLDWTYSPYVAAFFALEELRADETCAIWAIDQDWLWERAKTLMTTTQLADLESDPLFIHQGTAQNILWNLGHVRPLVVPTNPFQLNDRLAAQQGVFLVPADITKSFAENLAATFGDADTAPHAIKFELSLSATELARAITDLQRNNVGRMSLFPGLGGLAMQLQQLIAVPRALEIEPNKE